MMLLALRPDRRALTLGALLAGGFAFSGCSGGGVSLAPVVQTSGSAAPASGIWVTAAGAAMQAETTGVTQQTFRSIFKPTVSSRGTVRVHISNVIGTAPLTIGAAHVGVVASGASVSPTSDVALTFSGAKTVTIPAGQAVYSDSAPLAFPYGALVAVTTYVSGSGVSVPNHNNYSLSTQYASASGSGDETGDLAGTSFAATTLTEAVDRVDLYGKYTGTVAFAGSSTTQGYGSDPNAYDDLVDDVATNLHAAGRDDLALANMAIAPDALLSGTAIDGIRSIADRLSSDFLTLPSLRTLVENGGDIDLKGYCATATSLIAGKRSILAQVHAANARIVLAVIAPTTFCGGQNPGGFGTQYPANTGEDAQRVLLDTWIASSATSTVSGMTEAPPGADGVVDLSTPIEDPSDPAYPLPAYDVGDDSHLNAAGQKVQAAAIPLSVL